MRLIRTYSMCASVFRQGEACSIARGAGAASGGESARGPRPGDVNDPLHIVSTSYGVQHVLI